MERFAATGVGVAEGVVEEEGRAEVAEEHVGQRYSHREVELVVEGRAKSTTGQPLGDVNGVLATTSSLAQSGITYLHQIKGG